MLTRLEIYGCSPHRSGPGILLIWQTIQNDPIISSYPQLQEPGSGSNMFRSLVELHEVNLKPEMDQSVAGGDQSR